MSFFSSRSKNKNAPDDNGVIDESAVQKYKYQPKPPKQKKREFLAKPHLYKKRDPITGSHGNVILFTEEEFKIANGFLHHALELCDGNKSELARRTGVARNTISYWFTNGYIGAKSAREMVEDGQWGVLSVTEIRPDLS